MTAYLGMALARLGNICQQARVVRIGLIQYFPNAFTQELLALARRIINTDDRKISFHGA